MEHKRLYVVDNSSEIQSVKNYLTEWCNVSKQMDIATGYFEIGGLALFFIFLGKLPDVSL